MKIQDKIKTELVDLFISEMNKNLLRDDSEIFYGNYSFFLDVNYNKINNKNIGKFKIYLGSNPHSHYNKIVFTIDVQKNKSFIKKLSLDKQLQNKLYNLCENIYKEMKNKEQIEKNKTLIDALPKERKDNILREMKLNRIIN